MPDLSHRLVGTLDLDGDGQVTFEEGQVAAEQKAHLESQHALFRNWWASWDGKEY